MLIRTIVAAIIVTGLLGRPALAECKKTDAGAPMATGVGNGAGRTTPGHQRLVAERAAFLDALTNLKACLGDDAKKVTGWSISDIRYFDADPMVEMDVAASFDANPRVTVVGSAFPNVEKAVNSVHARVQTTRGAVVAAQRNAKEALEVVFPESGPGHETKQSLAGTLMGCSTDSINYWEDAAVSVKLTCGKGVSAGEAPKPAGQPPVEQHSK